MRIGFDSVSGTPDSGKVDAAEGDDAGDVFDGGGRNDAGDFSDGGGQDGADGTGGDTPVVGYDCTTRWPLTIDNLATQTLGEGFQILVNVTGLIPEGPIGADTMRVLYQDGHGDEWVEVHRVEDLFPSTTWIWFGLQAPIGSEETSSSYSLCKCAVNCPTPLEDPYQVFDFYDDFSLLDDEIWETMTGAATVSNGLLHIEGRSDSIRSKVVWPPGYAVDFALRVRGGLGEDGDVWGGWQRARDFVDEPPSFLFISESPLLATMMVEYRHRATFIGGGHALDDGEHIYGTDRLTNNCLARFDNTLYVNFGYNPSFLDSLQIRINVRCSASTHLEFDFVRVRKTAYPPPEVTVGAPIQP